VRRPLARQNDAAHRTAAGNADAWNHFQLLSQEFEDGNNTQVRLAALHEVRAFGRQPEIELEIVPLLAVQKAPNQGRRIQITYRTDFEGGWDLASTQMPV
jgi:hypothetical protein